MRSLSGNALGQCLRLGLRLCIIPWPGPRRSLSATGFEGSDSPQELAPCQDLCSLQLCLGSHCCPCFATCRCYCCPSCCLGYCCPSCCRQNCCVLYGYPCSFCCSYFCCCGGGGYRARLSRGSCPIKALCAWVSEWLGVATGLQSVRGMGRCIPRACARARAGSDRRASARSGDRRAGGASCAAVRLKHSAQERCGDSCLGQRSHGCSCLLCCFLATLLQPVQGATLSRGRLLTRRLSGPCCLLAHSRATALPRRQPLHLKLP